MSGDMRAGEMHDHMYGDTVADMTDARAWAACETVAHTGGTR